MTASVAPAGTTAGAIPTAAPGGVARPPLAPSLALSGADFASLLSDAGAMGEKPLGMAGPPPASSSGRRPGAPAAAPEPRAPLRDDEKLDRLSRHHALLRPPEALCRGHEGQASPGGAPLETLATKPVDATQPCAARSLEDLLPSLVRRVAWSVEGSRGTIRLELGGGRLAGATLLVQAEGGRVRVRLDVPPGVDSTGLRERIEQRLRSRGVSTESVEVA